MALPEKRWIQRLDNYAKAFAILERVHNIQEERELTEAERMGLIQSFEFTFELAWNLMKDYLHHKGISRIVGSRDAIRNAFKNDIIENGEIWMDMIERRNETVHAYDEEVAIRVVNSVSDSYIEEMEKLLKTMRKYQSQESEEK
ncbi:MAG: nucleotidyltransferase substrate binding protein [Chitinispirillales bacterium]|jgi:nucleotidyltransferase substrate binding protein (TIGR01987 family)|nr:nucleotidyltransferase substrate binding protein [Chitinispirillales bacterium]